MNNTGCGRDRCHPFRLYIFTLMLILSSCSSSNPMIASNVFVVVDVFSGRENPSWSLNAVDTAELWHRLKVLPRIDKPIPNPPGLGYRGMLVIVPESNGPGTVLRAYAGTVLGPEGLLADSEHDMERWLLHTAKSTTMAVWIDRIFPLIE